MPKEAEMVEYQGGKNIIANLPLFIFAIIGFFLSGFMLCLFFRISIVVISLISSTFIFGVILYLFNRRFKIVVGINDSMITIKYNYIEKKINWKDIQSVKRYRTIYYGNVIELNSHSEKITIVLNLFKKHDEILELLYTSIPQNKWHDNDDK